MTTTPGSTSSLVDVPVSIQVRLAALWTTMLFVFAYVDIFGFWRADVLRGALAREVPGPGFTIDQTFLLLTTVYVVLPSVMIAFSVLAPAGVVRPITLAMAGIYLLTIAGSMIGETWAYYFLGSAVEIGLLLIVAVLAWRWPRV